MKEIRRIIALYDQLRGSATPAALAVVVAVAESSYRRVGARLLVSADGRYVGGISGGCLEGDALRRARTAILAGQPAVHTYDTMDGEDAVIGVGLGCEGRIDVLFVPLNYDNPANEIELLRELAATRVPRLLLRWLTPGAEGRFDATPQTDHDLASILARTSIPETDLREALDEVLQLQRSKSLTLSAPAAAPTKLFVEVLRPEIHLVLTGTNYDIPPTLLAARQLGWRTTLVGPRRKFTTELTRLADHCIDYNAVDIVTIDAATAVTLMSHDFDWDRRMVEHFLPLNPPYFGMLGPRKRARKMADILLAEGGPDLLAYPHLYSPVGLDVGAETPEEIAASLTAEIVAVFRGREGGMLRERVGPIHER